MDNSTVRKIALVTHEFGLMRNGGGIGSYLYSYVKMLLKEYPDLQVHVITCHLHEKCDLLSEELFFTYTLKSNVLSMLGAEVLDILKRIKPEYVETTDYLALALEAMVYKNVVGNELEHTIFMEYTHTASKEIYEWGKCGRLDDAPRRVKVPIGREWAQLVLADIVISPSLFLRNYVHEHYKICMPEYVPYVFDYKIHNRQALKNKMDELYDFGDVKGRFIVSCLSRFEKRKNQQMLVDTFLRFIKEVADDALLFLIGNSMADMETGHNLMFEVYKTIPDNYKRNIRFFEFATAEEKHKIFSISDLAVMASPYENFPFSMIEAVCCGVPIMTSVHCGCCDYMGIYREETSFNPFSEEDLFNKMTRFFKMQKNQREDITEEQRRNLQALCCLEQSVYRKWKLYFEMESDDIAVQSEYPLICLNYKGEEHVVIENECSLLVIHENDKIDQKERLSVLLAKVNRHEGKFAISLGADCLHTDIHAAWEEGFPLLFTHVMPIEEKMETLIDRLIRERAQFYFSIPVGL